MELSWIAAVLVMLYQADHRSIVRILKERIPGVTALDQVARGRVGARRYPGTSAKGNVEILRFAQDDNGYEDNNRLGGFGEPTLHGCAEKGFTAQQRQRTGGPAARGTQENDSWGRLRDPPKKVKQWNRA